MKLRTIRDFKAVATGGIALVALLIFALAMIAPDAFGSISHTNNVANSPLGIACAVEHAVASLLN